MRLTSAILAPLAFVGAASFALLGATWAVTIIETRSSQAVNTALLEDKVDWARVQVDGLQLTMTGTAPTEAERFRALTIAGEIVDAARVIDAMDVAPATEIAAPRYSVEILRNGDGISLGGLIPATSNREALLADITGIAAGASVADMLGVADFAAPPGWDAAMAYGIAALKLLPRSKISISAAGVTITAISDSAAEKRKLEAELAGQKPEGLALTLNISAPRPVITPFTLRFLIDERGARFDACSADTEAARATILQAAVAAGLAGLPGQAGSADQAGQAGCTLGLGSPTPSWAEGVAIAIAGLAEIGGGTVTFSDTDVSLVAGPKVTQADFDRVVGDLEAKLPDVFSLAAVMPEKPTSATDNSSGPAEFTASLADSGTVELRGRLPNERVRAAVVNFAKARFGADSVYAAPRLDDSLPAGWPVRVLSALQALGELDSGDIRVLADLVEVRGVTGNPQASAEISRLLSEKLGQGQDFRIIVRYDKALDPNAGLPTAQECADLVAARLTEHKITFAPGKADIDTSSAPTLDSIAKIFARCGALPMEIGGHTDAQGREEMNLALSQSRAEAVRTALMERGVLTAALSAKGYGESLPIADNGTDAGREINRRIEFKLLLGTAEAGKIAQATVAADAAAPADPDSVKPDPGNPAQPDPAQPDPAQPDPAQPDPAQPDPANPADAAAEPNVLVRPAAQNQIHPKPRPEGLAKATAAPDPAFAEPFGSDKFVTDPAQPSQTKPAQN